MNSIELYQNIPPRSFPCRVHIFPYGRCYFELHWHEHVEIHCILEGEAVMRCGEEFINLSAGDCAIFNGNELHAGIGGECRYACLVIPPDMFGDNHVLFKRIIRDKKLYSMLADIFEDYKSFDCVKALLITGKIYLMLNYIINNCSCENLSEFDYKRHFEKLERINRVIKHIEWHFTEDMTTAELAQLVHLSEGHFCHMFKAVTGKSAKEYLLQLRISKAKELLISSNLSVTEVCCVCGFSDPNYFARVFKKKLGVSPSSCRLK